MIIEKRVKNREVAGVNEDKQAKSKVISIFQPHRYSRLAGLFEDFTNCFVDSDMIFVTEVFAAGEAQIEGINSKALVAALVKHGKDAYCVKSADAIPAIVMEHARSGDLIMMMGAGSISTWANNLEKDIEKLLKSAH